MNNNIHQQQYRNPNQLIMQQQQPIQSQQPQYPQQQQQQQQQQPSTSSSSQKLSAAYSFLQWCRYHIPHHYLVPDRADHPDYPKWASVLIRLDSALKLIDNDRVAAGNSKEFIEIFNFLKGQLGKVYQQKVQLQAQQQQQQQQQLPIQTTSQSPLINTYQSPLAASVHSLPAGSSRLAVAQNAAQMAAAVRANSNQLPKPQSAPALAPAPVPRAPITVEQIQSHLHHLVNEQKSGRQLTVEQQNLYDRLQKQLANMNQQQQQQQQQQYIPQQQQHQQQQPQYQSQPIMQPQLQPQPIYNQSIQSQSQSQSQPQPQLNNRYQQQSYPAPIPIPTIPVPIPIPATVAVINEKKSSNNKRSKSGSTGSVSSISSGSGAASGSGSGSGAGSGFSSGSSKRQKHQSGSSPNLIPQNQPTNVPLSSAPIPTLAPVPVTAPAPVPIPIKPGLSGFIETLTNLITLSSSAAAIQSPSPSPFLPIKSGCKLRDILNVMRNPLHKRSQSPSIIQYKSNNNNSVINNTNSSKTAAIISTEIESILKTGICKHHTRLVPTDSTVTQHIFELLDNSGGILPSIVVTVPINYPSINLTFQLEPGNNTSISISICNQMQSQCIRTVKEKLTAPYRLHSIVSVCYKMISALVKRYQETRGNKSIQQQQQQQQQQQAPANNSSSPVFNQSAPVVIPVPIAAPAPISIPFSIPQSQSIPQLQSPPPAMNNEDISFLL